MPICILKNEEEDTSFVLKQHCVIFQGGWDNSPRTQHTQLAHNCNMSSNHWFNKRGLRLACQFVIIR